MPGSLTTYAQGKVADAVLGAQSLGAPATWYLGWFTVAPTSDAGTGGTEATGGSYARVAVTNNLTNFPAYSGAGNVKQNASVIAFPAATADQGTCVAWGLWDDPTAGNLWIYGDTVSNGLIFASDGSTDVLYSPGHGLSNTNTVTLRPFMGSIPSGLTEGTIYFVRDATTDSFKLALTSGGAAINIGSGSGLVGKITTQAIANGNTAQFNANSLKVYFF